MLEFVEGTPIFDSEERCQSKLASDFYFLFFDVKLISISDNVRHFLSSDQFLSFFSFTLSLLGRLLANTAACRDSVLLEKTMTMLRKAPDILDEEQ